MNINRISSYNNILDTSSKYIKNDEKNLNFTDFLKDAINKVNEMQLDSEDLKNKLITGEVDNLHDITIATEKANIALQITMSIRNKIVEAYKEILRIQI